MFLKSSPTAQKAVKEALGRMESGKSDKAPTREETKQRVESRKKEQQESQIKADKPNIAALEKRHAEMTERYNKLGGKGHQYADREQHLSDEEREARGMEYGLKNLGDRISSVKRDTSSYAKGGKISLKDCGTSTAAKGKKNPNW